MDISGGGGSVFELQGSVSVDVSSLEDDLQSAIDAAGELQDALDEITDADADVNVDADDAKDDVGELTDKLDEIQDVDATIDVDTGSAADDVQEVADSVSSINDQSGTASTGVDALADTIITVLGGAAVAGAISGVYNSLKDLVSATTSAGDTIDKQSDQLGLTRKEYQEWDYIMQLCGSDVGTMGRMMNKLSDPSKSVSSAISELGINMDEFATMSRGDQFATVVKGLQNIKDETQRNKAAQEIFGNQWKNIATLLEQSPEFIDGCKDSMEELGMYMSDDDIDAAAGFSDAMTTLNTTFESLKNDIVADVLPTLTDFFNGISGVIGDIHSIFSSLGDPTIVTNLDTITTKFNETIDSINQNDVEATAIIDALAELSNQERLTEDQVAEWNVLKSQLEDIVPGIGSLFEDEAGHIKGGADALKAHKDALFADLRAQAAATAAQEKLNALAEEQKKLVNLSADAKKKSNIAAQVREAAGQNLLEAASMLGEEWVDRLVQAVNSNTDELGSVDWSSVVSDANLYSDEATQALIDNGGSATEYMEKLTNATTKVADAEKEAADAQQKFADGKTVYDEVAAETEIWIEALSEVTDTQSDTVSNTASSTSSIEGDISSMESSVSSDLSTMASTAKTECQKFNEAVSGLKSKKVSISIETTDKDTPKTMYPNATGLDYVPYDNYPALLHKGEMVLTSLESRNYRNGNSGGGLISKDAVEAMANMIAGAVASRPISFGIDSHDIAVRTRSETSRQSAARSVQVASGYGRGGF